MNKSILNAANMNTSVIGRFFGLTPNSPQPLQSTLSNTLDPKKQTKRPVQPPGLATPPIDYSSTTFG